MQSVVNVFSFIYYLQFIVGTEQATPDKLHQLVAHESRRTYSKSASDFRVKQKQAIRNCSGYSAYSNAINENNQWWTETLGIANCWDLQVLAVANLIMLLYNQRFFE